MKTINYQLFLIGYLLLFFSTNINSQSLLNGGFESWPPGCPFNTAPDDWTNFSTNLGPDQAGSCTGSVTSQEGNSHLNLVWSTSSGLYEGVQQAVSGLTVGKTYSLTFYAIEDAGLYSGGGSCVVDVYLNSNVVYSTPELSSGGSWAMHTINFVASSTSQDIKFRVRDGSIGTSGSAGIDDVRISVMTGLKNTLSDRDFNIYPNPFIDKVHIETKDHQNANVRIYSVLGHSFIGQYKLNYSNDNTLDLNFLPLGIYWFHLNVDGKSAVKKVVK
jgi:hypothetical protein